MDVTIIAETQDGGLHPVTAQLVGAASNLGASPTVVCPGGAGGDEACGISGVGKVLAVTGDCFATYDGGAWAEALDAVAAEAAPTRLVFDRTYLRNGYTFPPVR